jgi:hypothetical protein
MANKSEGAYSMYYNVDSSKWIRQDPKKNRNNNGLSVYFRESSFSSKAPTFQLERCRTPWGLTHPSESNFKFQGDQNSSRMTLTLSVGNECLKEWASKIDTDNITWITENCPRIFNREIERSTVEQALYNCIIKDSKVEGYEPLMKIKVNTSGKNATKIKIVSSSGKEYRDGVWSEVVSDSEVVAIVEANCLWFANNSCGSTLLATHLLVFPPKEEEDFPFQMSQTFTKTDVNDNNNSNKFVDQNLNSTNEDMNSVDLFDSKMEE